MPLVKRVKLCFLTLWIKKCPKCAYYRAQKWGLKRGRQNYKCTNCKHSFQNKRRVKSEESDWIKKAYHQYAIGRQTLKNLTETYCQSSKTIQKLFDELSPVTGEIKIPRVSVSVIIDGTFFSRRDGVLVARANSKNIVWKQIETEKVEHYAELIQMMTDAGIQINSFVIDGRRGVINMLIKRFSGKPVQLCQFHQIQTMTKYLSKKPKLQAGRELRVIALTLTETDCETLTEELGRWHEKWSDFLAEKTRNPETNRWHYTHRRLRSAYRSLKTNLPWLFTYQKYPELNIPNTTNSCDGSFSHWKNGIMELFRCFFPIKVHRGLRRDRKVKMMNYLLENS